MDTAEVIRAFSLLLRVVIVVLCLEVWRKRPKDRLWTVAPLSYAVNGIAYYVVVLMHLLTDPVVLSVWSASLGFHVGILIAGGIWLFLWPGRGRG